MKRLLDSPVGIAVIAWIAASYIRLVWATRRWTGVGREQIEDSLIDGARRERRGREPPAPAEIAT